jgi:imidazolonepropionase-like amidohydrolase
VLLPGSPQAGYVAIENEKIVSIVAARSDIPAGARIIDTDGVIAPGLIDLHNHVAFTLAQLAEMGRHGMKIVWSPYESIFSASN